MRTMTLCPGCHSIRKAGTTCPLCICPVPEASVVLVTAAASGGTTKKIIPASKAEAISRLQNRDVFCD